MQRQVFAVVLGAALLGPALAAQAQPTLTMPTASQPADTGYEADMMNRRMFASGAVVFGGSYMASVIAAQESDRTGDRNLYVPIAGPWLDLADRSDCSKITDGHCDDQMGVKLLLIADGVFQAAGVLGMLQAIVAPSHHRRVAHVVKRDVHITPSLKNGAPGLQVMGHF